jgi:uncharacterized LabA/DUF88 family protein
MGLNKVAILIDGGFFIQRFRYLNHRQNPTKQDVELLISQIMDDLKSKNPCPGLHPDVLLRTFYYDCEPFGKVIENEKGTPIDFSKKATYKNQMDYLRSLDQIDQFALRRGDLSFTGWKARIEKPKSFFAEFRQKGVDMKIGLDIAWMAGKKTVDKIVLVAGDSDFISPMKLARREGIQIYLYPMGNKLKHELFRHADFLIEIATVKLPVKPAAKPAPATAK